MKMTIRILYVVLICLTLSPSAMAAGPVRVIFDTDMSNDCDDAGALAVLNALADQGRVEILAVLTNRKSPSNASGAAVDAINTYYGRGEIPIGSDKDGSQDFMDRPSSFTPALRDEFPHDSPPDDELPDALAIYRRTLSEQPDNSVVICSVGALSNLQDLLASQPDEMSPLSGTELIRKKVLRTVVMGGQFPRTTRPNTNILLDVPAAIAVAENWPTRIIWSGFEVGKQLQCGAPLKTVSRANPVRRAFALRPYPGGKAIDRGKPAHDQAAVLVAIEGPLSQFWRFSEPGRVELGKEGRMRWGSDPHGPHRHAILKGPPKRLARRIDRLMVQPPRNRNE